MKIIIYIIDLEFNVICITYDNTTRVWRYQRGYQNRKSKKDRQHNDQKTKYKNIAVNFA
jgi:hypothetical protein